MYRFVCCSVLVYCLAAAKTQPAGKATLQTETIKTATVKPSSTSWSSKIFRMFSGKKKIQK